jgi:branched-chain amino acid transport system permease protein
MALFDYRQGVYAMDESFDIYNAERLRAADTLHTIHQPIVSPSIAGLGWTVAALLIILIGGIGTLSGALVGAAVFRLLQFYLDRWFGDSASFLLGLVYVLLVIFIPFGIVGTYRARSLQIQAGRDRLLRLFGFRKPAQS